MRDLGFGATPGATPEIRSMRQRLTCVECGRMQPAGARGWKAYLTTDEDEPAGVVSYCASCAEREFGRPM